MTVRTPSERPLTGVIARLFEHKGVIRPDGGGPEVLFYRARFRGPQNDVRPGVRVEYLPNQSDIRPMAEELCAIGFPDDAEQPHEISFTPPQR